MKKSLALVFAFVLCLALSACGKSEAATNYENLVAAIGTVSLDSGDAISSAEKAYAALPEKDQKAVAESNKVLIANRAEFDALVKAEEEARLKAEEEARLKAEEEARIAHAAEVSSAIDAIGAVSLDSKEAVANAKKLYNALTAEEKKLVTNYSVLENAEAAYDTLWEAEKQKIIDEYSKKFDIERDPVEGISWYTPKNMPTYIDTRSYIIPYIGVKGNNTWMCIRYNYTDDDQWIFWKKLTIVVDDDKYYKTIKYSDAIRDNDTDVWEYWDECLNFNQAMDSSDVKMLNAIANSQQTIIRFEGDEYHYDLYVTDKDKTMIRDTLALYEAMLG